MHKLILVVPGAQKEIKCLLKSTSKEYYLGLLLIISVPLASFATYHLTISFEVTLHQGWLFSFNFFL
jgi:hypothetical protein